MKTLCLLLLTLTQLQSSRAAEIRVSPVFQTDCITPYNDSSTAVDTELTDIDQAIREISSNTTIFLEQGCHVITQFFLIRDLSDVSVIGYAEDDGVPFVTCNENLGLALLNITGLTIVNLTIHNCGLKAGQPQLVDALRIAQESIDEVFYQIPIDSKVAVFLFDIANLSIVDVNFVNTSGLALLAINLMGDSLIRDVVFDNNRILDNSYPFCSSTAGGMFLLYMDYLSPTMQTSSNTLNIYSCVFKRNRNCGYGFLFTQPDAITHTDITYNVTYSSGLAISLAQLQYSVSITVRGTHFIMNTGYAGGLGITLFKGIRGSKVSIEDCVFTDNDLGFGMQTNALNPNLNETEILSRISTNTRMTNTVTIKGTSIVYSELCVFLLAFYPLSVSFAHQDLFLMEESTFANATSAFIGRSLQGYGFLPGILVHFKSVQIYNIQVNESDTIQFNQVGAIQAYSLNFTISGISTLRDNLAPAIFAERCTINIDGTVTFLNNRASIGGAMYLVDDTDLLMHNNSALRLIKNAATIRGGAIYVDANSVEEDRKRRPDYYYCFISFVKLDEYYMLTSTSPNLTGLNVSIEFINNTAPLGSSIFGSSLAACSWLRNAGNLDNKESAEDVFRDLPLSFTPPINQSNVINTGAANIVIHNSSVSVLPGQLVEMNVSARDALNQYIPWVITSAPTDHNSDSNSTLGGSGFWLLPGDSNSTLMPTHFYSQEESRVNFSLLGAISSFPRTSFEVIFGNCSLGFEFQDGSCICSPDIPVTCHNETFQIEVESSHWFGQTDDLGYIYSYCSLDYCQQNNVLVTSNTDEQCNEDFGRTGLLCGECKENLSTVFGSNRCLHCSNANIALLLFFIVAGILLVLAVTYFNITIADGYINGIIFFSNIVSVYKPFFLQNLPYKYKYFYAFIPMSLINLDIGFEVCFYDGMSVIVRSLLYLFFPFYLFLLMLLIALVVKHSVKLSNISNSMPRSFATIFLISFTNLGQTCIQIISFSYVNGTENVYYGWYMAPDVSYADPWHIALVLVALFILLGLLCVAVFLLIPPLAVLLKLEIKLLPLLDAFWNPFMPKFRFWLGLRLFFRIVAFIVAYFVPYPYNLFYFGLLGLGLLKLHHDITNPFKGKAQNVIDQTLIFCLVVIAFSALFKMYIVVVLAVTTAYACFVLVFTIHIFLRFPKLQEALKCIGSKIKNAVVDLRKSKKKAELVTSDSPVIQEPVQSVLFSSVTITELREPLLDDSF